MALTCFFIGIAILAAGIVFAIKNRFNPARWTASMTTAIFFATFAMILPTWVQSGGEELTVPSLNALASSLFYSFRSLTGSADLLQLEKISLEGGLKTAYLCVNYIAFIAAPLMVSSLLISFIGDAAERIRYFFSFSPRCCVFSGVNSNSVTLAKNIAKEEGRKTFVFCNSKDADKELRVQARELGGILLYKKCSNLKPAARFKEFEYYLVSGHEDENIEMAEGVISLTDKMKRESITVNAFVENGTNVQFLESLANSKNNGSKIKIRLRCIDVVMLLCNKIVYEFPLFDLAKDNRNISVAIVGCGKIGMSMLKTVYYAGVIDGYSLKIKVYDRIAKRIEQEFYAKCPEIKNDKTVEFIEVDVNSVEFKTKLKEYSGDATYVVVSMTDDQLNLSIADRLCGLFRRWRDFDNNAVPQIFTRISSDIKAQPLTNNIEFINGRHIHLFGASESLLSNATLFNSNLENLAFAVHLAYAKALGDDCGSGKYQEAWCDFQNNEYNRRLSVGAALHIPAKIKICLGDDADCKNLLSDEALGKFSKKVKEPGMVEKLAACEHERWVAFMKADGYEPFESFDEMRKLKKNYDSASPKEKEKWKMHKDEISKVHGCIMEWKDLDDLSAFLKQEYGVEKEFKSFDMDISGKIPEIVRKAREIEAERLARIGVRKQK